MSSSEESRSLRSLASPSAWLMAAGAFTIVLGYECLRSASASLFREAYGAEALPAVMAAVPVFVLGVLWAYNRVLTRFGPRRTLLISQLVSLLLIALSLILTAKGVREARIALYLIKDTYIVLLLEQLWSFMNSASERQFARRFHGIFAGLGNLGALFGGLVVGQWTMSLGTLGVPWLTVAALLPSVIFGEMAYRRAIEPRPKTPAQGGERMGAAEFRSQPVLPRILGIVLCTQVMAAVLEVSFQTHLSQGIQSIDSQTAYSGNFFAALSAVSVALQFAVAPLYFGRLSTRVVHVLLPVSNLLAIASLILAPSLWTASLALLVFKSVDYSLFRVAKELLYVPLDFSARYRAKELIDVFGYRLSKGVCSLGLIAIRQSAAGPLYAVIAALAAIGWLASVPGLVRASSSRQE